MVKLFLYFGLLLISFQYVLGNNISISPLLDWGKSYKSKCGSQDISIDGNYLFQKDIGSADCESGTYMRASEGLLQSDVGRNLRINMDYKQTETTYDAYGAHSLRFKDENDNDIAIFSILIMSSLKYDYGDCNQGRHGIAVSTNTKKNGKWVQEFNKTCIYYPGLEPAWDKERYTISVSYNNITGRVITTRIRSDGTKEEYEFSAPLFGEKLSGEYVDIEYTFSTSGWGTGTIAEIWNLSVEFEENKKEQNVIVSELPEETIENEDENNNYDCFVQVKNTARHIEAEYWITSLANTSLCGNNAKFKLSTIPEDVITDSVESENGNSLSVEIDTNKLYNKYSYNGTSTIRSIFSLYLDNILWLSVTKDFTWTVNPSTIVNKTVTSNPVIVNKGKDEKKVRVDTNLMTCSTSECLKSKSDFIIEDILTSRISPIDKIPDGLKLGKVLNIKINNKPTSIISQGKFSSGDLWFSVVLKMVCEECLLNVTSSIVPAGFSGRRLLNIEEKKLSFIQKINVKNSLLKKIDNIENQVNISDNLEEESPIDNNLIIIPCSIGGFLVLLSVSIILIKKRRSRL